MHSPALADQIAQADPSRGARHSGSWPACRKPPRSHSGGARRRRQSGPRRRAREAVRGSRRCRPGRDRWWARRGSAVRGREAAPQRCRAAASYRARSASPARLLRSRSPTMSSTSSTRAFEMPRRRARERRLVRADRDGMKAGLSMSAPIRDAYVRGSEIGESKTRALPLVGLMRPNRSLMSVDLPEPLGPTRPTTPLLAISRSSSRTATTSPKRRVSFSVRMTDMDASVGCVSERSPTIVSERSLVNRESVDPTPEGDRGEQPAQQQWVSFTPAVTTAAIPAAASEAPWLRSASKMSDSFPPSS